MSIFFGSEKRTISDVLISTAFGQNGRGMFPYTFSSKYRKLLELVKENNITIFAKSSTRYSRIGNFRIMNPFTWKYIQKISYRSMLNAYGLTNKGMKANAKDIAISCRDGFNVIPNYYPEFNKGIGVALQELRESVDICYKYIGGCFWAIEINGSCPNSEEEISENMDMLVKCVAMLKHVYPWLIVIVKTSIVHPYSFYKRLEDAGADVIHAINTIPYNLVFSEGKSPLHEKGGGGVSGNQAFLLSYDYNLKLRENTSLPIIMACGITDVSSRLAFSHIGANAVGICTIIFCSCEEAGNIIMYERRVKDETTRRRKDSQNVF